MTVEAQGPNEVGWRSLAGGCATCTHLASGPCLVDFSPPGSSRGKILMP
jgi:hypothetical protein